jgi:hypothetical protein
LQQHRFHFAKGKLVQLIITETFGDIPSSVHIRVTHKTAMLADKFGLRLAVEL